MFKIRMLLIAIALFTIVTKAAVECITRDSGCKGLILVDVQNDFVLHDGRLSAFSTVLKNVTEQGTAIPRGEEASKDFQNAIINYTTELINSGTLDFIVYSIDYHPGGEPLTDQDQQWTEENIGAEPLSDAPGFYRKGKPGIDYHCSFNTAAQIKNEIVNTCRISKGKVQNGWFPHCMQGENGAKFISDIPIIMSDNARVTTTAKIDKKDKALTTLDFDNEQGKTDFGEDDWIQFLEEVFDKTDGGALNLKPQPNNKIDQFFIFKGMNKKVDSYSAFLENDGSETGLDKALKDFGYKDPSKITLNVLGVAYDFCVKFTAMDAKNKGYEVNFISDLTQPIFEMEKTNEDLQKIGVKVITSQDKRRRLGHSGQRVMFN